MSGLYQPLFGSPVTQWHRWFAWRPVDTADRGWRWLRVVWRRKIQRHHYIGGPGLDQWFQFAVDIEGGEPGE